MVEYLMGCARNLLHVATTETVWLLVLVWAAAGMYYAARYAWRSH